MNTNTLRIRDRSDNVKTTCFESRSSRMTMADEELRFPRCQDALLKVRPRRKLSKHWRK
jgi:hypothetical protein